MVPQDNYYMVDSRDKANLTSMSLSKQRDLTGIGESRSQEKLEPKKKTLLKKADLGHADSKNYRMPYIDSKVATNTNNKMNIRRKKKSYIQGGQKSDRMEDMHIPAMLSVANQQIASCKKPANMFSNNNAT